MLNYNNIERIIENHWGLIKNSFGSLFLSGKWLELPYQASRCNETDVALWQGLPVPISRYTALALFMLSIGIHIQCFAIKTAVAFFERAAKSTVLAGIGFLCLRTEHKPNNLSRSISSCHCIVLNMVPSTSIEMHKVMVRWCFEQYKIAFEISVLFPAARSEQL